MMNERLETLFNQAQQLQQQENFLAAIKLYEQIINENPQHAPSLHFLGLAHAQLNHFDEATLYLSQAHALDPADPALLNNLGNIHKRLKQYDEAMKYYQEAILIAPNYAQAHNNLAAIYALQNNNPQALAHYVKAVHAAPDFSVAHFNLGLLLLKTQQFDAAKTQFNNVISLNPHHLAAHFYLGILYLEQNELDKAEQSFQEVLAQDDGHSQSLVNLGVIQMKKEQKQQAIDYFSKALALDNDNTEARNNLAATFMHHDRFENALMHYDVLLKNEPDNIEYLYNSGVAQMALGHLNEAIVFFNHVLSLEEKHAASLNNLAAIYLKMDDRETAREYLNKAVSANAGDSISKHMLQALDEDLQATTNTEYTHNLFNNYALYYDQHMNTVLNYGIPQQIAQTLHQLSFPKEVHTLDLGCGTGLTGTVLRETSQHLTGVDISNKMIEQAREKNIYDQLIAEELETFLRKQSQRYDLIVAADVLPYLGSLADLFKLIADHLNNLGYFIFTTEISEKEPWFLQSTVRFSHHPDYINDLITTNHLRPLKKEKVVARMQNGQPLHVMLYLCQCNGPLSNEDAL